MNKRFFGTDGVRGVANKEPITAETVLRLGKAVAKIVLGTLESNNRKILIGKDTRLSGSMLEMALAAGICSMGVDVLLVGEIPTPAVAFLTTDMMCDAGAVISASHNPFEDNGIKFFGKRGLKLDDDQELAIESVLVSETLEREAAHPHKLGRVFNLDDALERYLVFLKNSLPKDVDLKGLKIAVDCANGAGFKAAPQVFQELGAEVICLSAAPDGKNINLDCGSLHPEQMTKELLKQGANLGVALDGDGDRAIFADEQGNVIDGDRIMGMVAWDMFSRGLLKRDTLVATVMSNLGLEIAMKEKGINMVRTPVGDRYVVEKMLSEGYNFGGEQSGHLVFFDYSTTGDGILSALRVAAIMNRTSTPLSQLTGWIKKYPQVLKNLPVSCRVNLDEVPVIKKVIEDCKRRLGNSGRILVRYSGTQSLCRVMVEGKDQELVDQVVEEVSEALVRNI
ncbi:MAG: phosphoglucosamine mutase [Deltaproteobacteria bacterium]|nr:phosphoglucosamine mutase [Deltaproteobacteria bacterium]